MKCQIMTGSVWDNINEVILNWDKRVPCINDANYIYACFHPSFKGAEIFLCKEHHYTFAKFAGILKSHDAQDKNNS
jgi:hypothetical protein